MGVFAKMCSVEAFQRAKSTRTGISVWISCLVAISKGCTVSPGFLSGVDSCNVCCSLRAGEDNDIILLGYGMVWYGMVSVWFLVWLVMVCYVVLKPVSRWGQCPPAGILWREICTGLPSRLPATAPCRTCSPYCSLSRRHSPGWSHLCFWNYFPNLGLYLVLTILPCQD